ncbi:MAG: methylmalonyl Co-A mutase-associated GTPase MeaB [Victivallales bacterium]|nr:methylmalonyl Co-A mutase-associated GTPase MeaB [Victivallales bacterium]
MKLAKAEDFVKGIVNGSKKALSKAITHIESTHQKHQTLADEIMRDVIPYTGNSIRLGITGVPGVGKSTFIEALGMYLIEQGHKVAVLAIDPSSTLSGGSILADKTRMELLSSAENAFIRPSPSGKYLGGIAQKTRETMLLCEAAGYDVIIIETVGVGQSETEAAGMVDFFLFLALANAGDELQGIKKGILELADAIAINKADKNNIEQAEAAQKIYFNALHIVNPASKYWNPKVLMCSSIEKSGIKEIWDVVLEHNKIFRNNGELDKKRHDQSVKWMWSIIKDGINQYFTNMPKIKNQIQSLENDIRSDKQTPANAAKRVLNLITNMTAE